jgi:hypothetical protein
MNPVKMKRKNVRNIKITVEEIKFNLAYRKIKAAVLRDSSFNDRLAPKVLQKSLNAYFKKLKDGKKCETSHCLDLTELNKSEKRQLELMQKKHTDLFNEAQQELNAIDQPYTEFKDRYNKLKKLMRGSNKDYKKFAEAKQDDVPACSRSGRRLVDSFSNCSMHIKDLTEKLDEETIQQKQLLADLLKQRVGFEYLLKNGTNNDLAEYFRLKKCESSCFYGEEE